MKRRKGKVFMWIAIGIVGVIVAGGLIGMFATAPGREELKKMIIADVDFASLRDGTYDGTYIGSKNHLNDAEVEATVSSGKVTGVKVLKGALDKEGKPSQINAQGATVTTLFDTVIASQSLEVDTVSGATLTSKAHLKALENALAQGQ